MSEAPLSDVDLQRLDALLDAVIPPDDAGRLPGAGELGLASVVVGRAADLAPLLRRTLDALDALARERGADDFAGLAPTDRGAVLDQQAARDPSFLPPLVFHTYGAYYESPRVLGGLGMPARPPHPEGYELEPGDLGRLDKVRRRGRLYREV